VDRVVARLFEKKAGQKTLIGNKQSG
jgi:hypothetical protein